MFKTLKEEVSEAEEPSAVHGPRFWVGDVENI